MDLSDNRFELKNVSDDRFELKDGVVVHEERLHSGILAAIHSLGCNVYLYVLYIPIEGTRYRRLRFPYYCRTMEINELLHSAEQTIKSNKPQNLFM